MTKVQMRTHSLLATENGTIICWQFSIIYPVLSTSSQLARQLLGSWRRYCRMFVRQQALWHKARIFCRVSLHGSPCAFLWFPHVWRHVGDFYSQSPQLNCEVHRHNMRTRVNCLMLCCALISTICGRALSVWGRAAIQNLFSHVKL